MQSVIIVLVVVLVLEIESAKTASRTTTSTSTNRMTNKIGVPQPIFSPTKFLFRSDWPFFQARGAAYMKLRLPESVKRLNVEYDFALLNLFNKIDRIPSFDIRYPLFTKNL